jgi:hypothetical protein
MHNLKQLSSLKQTCLNCDDISNLHLDQVTNTIIGISKDGRIVSIGDVSDRTLAFLPESLTSNLNIVGSGVNCHQNKYWFATQEGQIWDVGIGEDETDLCMQIKLHFTIQSATSCSEGNSIIVIPDISVEPSDQAQFHVLDMFYNLISTHSLEPLPSDATKAPVICNLKFDNHVKTKVCNFKYDLILTFVCRYSSVNCL